MRIAIVLLRAALHACNTTPNRRVAVISSFSGGWLRDVS